MLVKKWFAALAVAALLNAGPSAQAVTVTVTDISTAGPGSWGPNVVFAGGSVTLVDLNGAGGDLESSAPLPNGAVRLTTGPSNSDRAEIATALSISAATFLSEVDLGYSYYKATGPNPAPAPAMKIAIFAGGGTGDNFGQLVYEPNWNQPGSTGSSPPPTDTWVDVSIDETTGAGSTATGGWWWTGGFEIGSSAGGPPLRSLDEWLNEFTTADPTDFANAQVVGISVGIGSFNPSELNYFDNVAITVPGEIDVTYDFEAIPEPASLLLAGLLTATGACLRRR